jgi:RimJ/RimL family protein N-acetyltransferase
VAPPPALGPCTLEGRNIRLVPLHEAHADGLLQAAQHEEIWAWMSATPTSMAALREWLAAAFRAQAAGLEYAFTVVRMEDGRVLGSTRYMEVQAAHRGLEIGWTWYEPAVWGTLVNPEAKYLLLRHAFESWGAIRVQLKTDLRNLRSQAAIARLGAVREGVLRQHRIRRDGTRRDSVMFSIIDREWPAVKAGLEGRLNA